MSNLQRKLSALAWAAALLVAPAAGATDKVDAYAARLCEKIVLKHLKAPSTYKRISTSRFKSDETVTVALDYDAQNSFGALLRGKAYCEYDAPALSAADFAHDKIGDTQIKEILFESSKITKVFIEPDEMMARLEMLREFPELAYHQ